MNKTLDELGIGKWSDLITVTAATTIHVALSLFLGKGISALPVVDETNHVIDMLTKVDIMNLVIENQAPADSILQKTVQDAIGNRPEVRSCENFCTILLK